ncbi:unnamed protein product [Linum tenue]|uniref:Uncharacterized protein n=1 Tax=Linum tenue TaxID=586396 RepID=A0AAV0KYB9_9ROSI|nr:unnamed protein product [Linum tenue]
MKSSFRSSDGRTKLPSRNCSSSIHGECLEDGLSSSVEMLAQKHRVDMASFLLPWI